MKDDRICVVFRDEKVLSVSGTVLDLDSIGVFMVTDANRYLFIPYTSVLLFEKLSIKEGKEE